VVTAAVGADKRVGPKYLKGAIGYGGPCFPRDNVALGFMARALGSRADLSEITDSVNRALPEKIVKRLRSLVRRGTTVAILGLAYKPHSQIIEESQAIELAWGLFKAGARVVAYDPLARDGAQTEFRGQILMLDSLADCLAQAEVVLITTPDPAFQNLKAADFAGHEVPVTVVDFWRILEKELAGQPNIRYVPVGCSIDDAANAARLNELWNPGFQELKVVELPLQKSPVPHQVHV